MRLTLCIGSADTRLVFSPPCSAWVWGMPRSYATFYSMLRAPLMRNSANATNMDSVIEWTSCSHGVVGKRCYAAPGSCDQRRGFPVWSRAIHWWREEDE